MAKPSALIKRAQQWRQWHTVAPHIVAPVWRRIPEKRRWGIVYHLNRSKRFCWSSLVMAALNWFPDDDPCDQKLPVPDGEATRCGTVCEWGGEHDNCRCYCGKFEIQPRQHRVAAAVSRG